MTYGLKAINGSDYIQIDSDSPRLCAVYSGTYQAVGNRVATVLFPSPIRTTEPPCIFIRNSPTRPNDLYDGMTITGGVGNWTGFRITANNVNWRPSGKWFAAVFSARAEDDYGMRLWDESGKILYDSGTVPVIFTRANPVWSYQGRVTFPDYGSAQYYRNGAPSSALAEDEYFMINPLSRGVLSASLGWDRMGVRFGYTTGFLEMYIVTINPAGAWIDQGMPSAVFARLPGT